MKQYKTWFDNLSFFQNNTFILEEIEDLWNLVNYIGYKYQMFCNYEISDLEKYSDVTIKEIIDLSQNFFDDHDIKLDIKKLIKNKTLTLNYKVNKKTDDFLEMVSDGISYYDKDNERKVEVDIGHNIYDSIIIVHELMHYLNQPNKKRNFVSDLLTEAISYGAELIFCEDLKGTTYNVDRILYFKLAQKTMYNYMFSMHPIYKIVLLYKNKNDLSEKSYHELFGDDEYKKTIEKFEKYVSLKKNIIRDTWYVLGLPISIYILTEYQKESNFILKLKNTSDSINNLSLKDCLVVLGFQDKQDFINKIKCSTEEFILLLKELYEDEIIYKEDKEVDCYEKIIKRRN